MATKVGEAYYELTAKNAKLKAKLRESDQATSSWTKKMSAKIGQFGKMAFAAAIAGVVALTAATVKATQMAAAEELQTAQLVHQIERLGVSSVEAMKRVNALADEQQAYTRFGDTDTRRMLSRLIMLTDDFELSLKNVTLAQDLAESGLFDANSAVRMLGMALSGNIEILGRYIPELKTSNNEALKTMDRHEKAALAVEVLERKFGGLAREIGTTGAGAWAKLRNAIGDAWEALGAGALDKFNQDFRETTKLIKDMEPELKKLGSTGVTALTFLTDVFNTFTDLVDAASISLRKLTFNGRRSYEELRIAQLALLDQQLQEEKILERLQKAREEIARGTPEEIGAQILKRIDLLDKENMEIEESIQLFRDVLDARKAATASRIVATEATERMLEKIDQLDVAHEKEIKRQGEIRREYELSATAVSSLQSAQIEFLRNIGLTYEAERKMADLHYDTLLESAGKNVQARELIEAARAAKIKEISKKEMEQARRDSREMEKLFRPELVTARELGRRALLGGRGITETEVDVKTQPSNEDLKHTQQFELMITVMKEISDNLKPDRIGLAP